MANAKRKPYPPALRARAVRLVAERPEWESEWPAIQRVAQELGIGTDETLRRWVRLAQVEAGQRPAPNRSDPGPREGRHRRSWTQEEDEILASLSHDRTLAVKVLGRTRSALAHRAQVLGLPDKGSEAYRFSRYWQYRYLRDRGFTFEKIGFVFGISAVSARAGLLRAEGSPLKGTRAFRYPEVPECSVCRNPPYRLGLCAFHYRRLTRGIPLAAEKGYRPVRPETARQLARVKKLRTAGWTGPQIAKEMKLSLSRVDALLQQAGFSGQVKRPLKHGIPARWQAGCRCDLCVRSMEEYKQAAHQRAKQRAVDAWEAGGHLPGPHCPCPECRKAVAGKLAARLDRTKPGAVEHYRRWTEAEDEIALDHTRRIEDIAADLGRTYAAVDNRRRHLARKLKTQREQADTLES